MNLTVGQKVKVYDPFRRANVYDGQIVKVGRTLVTIQWDIGGFSPVEAQFRMEDGNEKGGGRYRFKTVEQAEADDRLAEAKGYLRENGVDVLHRAPHRLTSPQVEELAAIVRNMLAEKPADYESEIKGRY